MTRIDDTFNRLRKEGRKAFIAYICAGDPDMNATRQLVLKLVQSGVDIIELGVPFSDPLADGVVNQRASERALKNSVNLKNILFLVSDLRRDTDVPIVLFTYINPIMKFGLVKFPETAKKSGVDGILVLDYPPEEWGDYKSGMDTAGVDTIALISPTSSDERIDLISSLAKGFIYYVSRTGVTGARNDVDRNVIPMVGKIKTRTSIPVVVGFGISTPEQVEQIAMSSDGVVVGSAIVSMIEKYSNKDDLVEKVGDFTSSLTAPMRKKTG